MIIGSLCEVKPIKYISNIHLVLYSGGVVLVYNNFNQSFIQSKIQYYRVFIDFSQSERLIIVYSSDKTWIFQKLAWIILLSQGNIVLLLFFFIYKLKLL